MTRRTAKPRIDRVEVGREAENAAADYLISQGWTIVTRRYRRSRGEIDLVALDGDELVFVEVRSGYAPGYSPEESIGRAKLQAIARIAAKYVAESGYSERLYRFDLIAVVPDGIRHHKNIFA